MLQITSGFSVITSSFIWQLISGTNNAAIKEWFCFFFLLLNSEREKKIQDGKMKKHARMKNDWRQQKINKSVEFLLSAAGFFRWKICEKITHIIYKMCCELSHRSTIFILFLCIFVCANAFVSSSMHHNILSFLFIFIIFHNGWLWFFILNDDKEKVDEEFDVLNEGNEKWSKQNRRKFKPNSA